MSQSNTEPPAIVAGEGTAFNAPNSDRVPPTDDEGVHGNESLDEGTLEDDLEFMEQLSRLNSDFEDGLDVVRALESQCAEDERLSPTFASLLSCAMHKAADRLIAHARRHPFSTAIGVTVVGTAFGIVVARRAVASRT